MKVLVTGAAGLIGREVIAKLRDSGHEPVASDLAQSPTGNLAEFGCEYRPADITDPAQLNCLFDDADAVIHCAAIFDLGAPKNLVDRVNIGGTENVCRAAAESSARRFIHISTVGVFGRQNSFPVCEDAPKFPHNNYERSKWRSEQIAFSYHEKGLLDVSAVRPTLVYGPRAEYGLAMFAAVMSWVKIAGPIKGMPVVNGGPRAHFAHVEDVARAAVFLLNSDETRGEAFNVADLNPINIQTLSESFLNRFGLKRYGKIPYIPPIWKPLVMGLAGMPGVATKPLNRMMQKTWRKLIEQGRIVDVLSPRIDFDWLGYGDRDFVYSTEKIRAAGFDLKHPDCLKGFEETIDWYMENRWIPDFR